MTQSDTLGFSVRRPERTQPAEPAPTITTSNSASNLNFAMTSIQIGTTRPFDGTRRRVGSGLIKTMAQPGGNATGFVQIEYSLGNCTRHKENSSSPRSQLKFRGRTIRRNRGSNSVDRVGAGSGRRRRLPSCRMALQSTRRWLMSSCEHQRSSGFRRPVRPVLCSRARSLCRRP